MSPQAPVAEPNRVVPPLHSGPLADFVPAAGLEWLVIAKPRAIAEDPTLAVAVEALLPEQGLEAFAARTGVELRATEDAVVAGYPLATLFLVTNEETALVERAFLSRLLVEPARRRPHPRLLSLTGIVQARPYSLVLAKNQFVAIAVGDPQPARAVIGFALERLESPAAFEGAALASVGPHQVSAPLRFYAPGPFGGSWQDGGHGLLAAATAATVTLEAEGPSHFRVELALAGLFPPEFHAHERMDALWTDVEKSALGSLLGLDALRDPPVVVVDRDRVALRVSIAARPMVAGLRAAVSADVAELFALPPETGDQSVPTE
ncbi:MAG: hypothetical protein JW751_05990 [Polyangiaceae bacterium]|nr:hypothetical protein [Polyangiaceae bacterium]